MRVLLALLLSCPFASTMAQQMSPTVTIHQVYLDEGANTVTVQYTLADAFNDEATVHFRASLDEGVTFLDGPLTVSGDVGSAVAVGNRSLTWTYGDIPAIHNVTLEVIAVDALPVDIQALVDQVQPDTLAALLETLSIPRHHTSAPQGLEFVRNHILDHFGSLGLHTNTHTATYAGAQADNVLGRHTGLLDPSRTYIVDGHYDAVTNTPGADDNATAVAATLEIARILSQYRFRNSLRFIGFAFEEQGLIGSQQYVQNGIPAWEEVHGVLNMEMIGYYSEAPNSQSMPTGFELLFPAAAAELAANEFRGDFLTVVGNTTSDPLLNTFLEACDAYVPALKRIPLSVPGNGGIVPDLRRSDHAPFWDAGMKALMLTDGSNYRNPHYHLASDLPSTIDLPFLVNSTKAVLAAAAVLAEPLNAGSDRFSLSSLVGIHPHHHHGFPCVVEVYPNPASDHIHLRIEPGCTTQFRASLFDLAGNRMVAKMIGGQGDRDPVIPIQGLAAGTYLLVLEADESSRTIKVEVAR
jgi:hypothetical protein